MVLYVVIGCSPYLQEMGTDATFRCLFAIMLASDMSLHPFGAPLWDSQGNHYLLLDFLHCLVFLYRILSTFTISPPVSISWAASREAHEVVARMAGSQGNAALVYPTVAQQIRRYR